MCPHVAFPLVLARFCCFILALSSFSFCRGDEPPVDGQKFTDHTITDQTLSLPFMDLKAPVDWTVAGRVYWKAQNTANPVYAGILVTNSDQSEAITFFPGIPCFWLRGNVRNKPGTWSLGQLNLQPMPAANALQAAIKKLYRRGKSDLQFSGARTLPDLPSMLHQEPNTCQGIGLKVLYSEKGVQMEEEFYALYYARSAPYRGPVGQIATTDWGIDHVYSFKAPVGTLQAQRPTFNYVVQSLRMNPNWNQRKTEICKSLAATKKSEIDWKNKEIIETMQRAKEMAPKNRKGASAASERSESNGDGVEANVPQDPTTGWSHLMREDEPVHDPNTGTSTTRTNQKRYHWTNGIGDYYDTDDPNEDPNIGSSQTWTRMSAGE